MRNYDFDKFSMIKMHKYVKMCSTILQFMDVCFQLLTQRICISCLFIDLAIRFECLSATYRIEIAKGGADYRLELHKIGVAD